MAAQRAEGTFMQLLDQLERGNEMLAALMQANGLEPVEKPAGLKRPKSQKSRAIRGSEAGHGSLAPADVAALGRISSSRLSSSGPGPRASGSAGSGAPGRPSLHQRSSYMKRSLTGSGVAFDDEPAPRGTLKPISDLQQTFGQSAGRQSLSYRKMGTSSSPTVHSLQPYGDELPPL